MWHSHQGLVWMTAALLATGCFASAPNGPRFKTVPFTGVVKVDGTPAAGVAVTCTPLDNSSEIKFPVTATTDAAGRFSIGTYQAGDGLPAGQYALTFAWPEPGIVPKNKLSAAYADPKKSEHKVTIVAGKAQDLGAIELSSKGPSK